MGQRLQVTESRQQRVIAFLAKAIQNPAFLAQFMSQQNESKRMVASVRKKRRLPKQEDEGEIDDSLCPESPAENQIVTFQPNGVGEAGTRAMLMQMFNPDSSPGIDSSHFEALLREMDPAPSGGEGNLLNRQSRATLAEISNHFPNMLSSAPIVTDVSNDEGQEDSYVSPASLEIPSLAGLLLYSANDAIRAIFMWFERFQYRVGFFCLCKLCSCATCGVLYFRKLVCF